MGAELHESGVDREFLSLERELTLLLRRARASSGEMARQVHPDLEPAAYGLLVCLDDSGPQRATDLAAYIGVGKATMSLSRGRWRNWVLWPGSRILRMAGRGSSTSPRRAALGSPVRCGRGGGSGMCGSLPVGAPTNG